jgi:hypothetical protein
MASLLLASLNCVPVVAEPVSIELVLAVDTSASVNDMEYALQMRGIASALQSDDIIHAVEQHKHGVAISVLQWSGFPRGQVAVDWTVVSSAASVTSLATRIANTPRTNTGNYTSISSAIDRAVEMLETNRQQGEYRRIDVSGDGRNNSGQHPSITREKAITKGITINGLAILDGDVGLAAYYRTHVTGGPGSFVLSAKDFDDFARAMKRKLERELSINVTLNYEQPARCVPAGNTREVRQLVGTGKAC